MVKANTIIFLLFIFLFSACSDWLTLKPQDAIIKPEFWQTKEQVKSAVIGCYASLLGNAGSDKSRSMAELLFLWGELRTDMIAPSVGTDVDELQVINGNILQSNSITSWKPLYRTINSCNTVIQFAPGVRDIDKTFTQEQLDAYLAEVLTLRAMMYFYLVRVFGEVPLKITPTVTDIDIKPLAKSSQQEVLDQIVADLAVAEASAPLAYNDQKSDKGRITLYTVYALQADVYLWRDEFDKCIVACNHIIDSGQFGLVPGSFWLRGLFAIGNSNESIFEFQFDQQKINPFYYMFKNNSLLKEFSASGRVLDEVYTLDFINPDNKDDRGDGASLRGDGTIWKYIGLDKNTVRSTEAASYAHWIVYRLADIRLLKAEALINTGQGQLALNEIDLIRTRASALDATKRDPELDDVDALTDYLLEERARELAFEGKRWFDVLRNAKRNNYKRRDLLINMAIQGSPPDRLQSIIQKYFDNNSHYWPISFDELTRNTLLVQNPFYTK